MSSEGKEVSGVVVSPEGHLELRPGSEGSDVIRNAMAGAGKALGIDQGKMMNVACGPNVLPNQTVVGMTVGAVRGMYREVLNIPEGCAAIVRGQTVGDQYTLQPGDQLEFLKPSSEKG